MLSKYLDYLSIFLWSPLVRRHLLTTYYGLYFSHHLCNFICYVKYNSKYSMLKCNLKCLIFLRTIFYFDELYKHFGSSLQKRRLCSSVKYIDLKSAHTHRFFFTVTIHYIEMRMGTFFVSIQIQKKLSPLPGFEPMTYQVAVNEVYDKSMCHRASVIPCPICDRY